MTDPETPQAEMASGTPKTSTRSTRSKPMRSAQVAQMLEADLLDLVLTAGESIDAKVAAQVQVATSVAQAATAKAARAFRRFDPSKHSAEERASDPTYVAPGVKVTDVTDQVMAADLQVMREDETKLGLSVQLSDHEVAELGLHRTTDGVQATEVSLAAVAPLLQRRLPQGPILATDLARDCRASLTAQRLMTQATAPEVPSQRPQERTAPSTSSVVEVEELVKKQVSGQLAYTTAPEEHVAFGVPSRATQDTLQQAVSSLTLRSGPADVTSYHDFYDLQIAFRHVWTELLDPDMQKAGLALYEDLVKLKQQAGIKTPSGVVNTSDDLRDLIEELGKLRAVLAGSDPRLQIVQQYFPDCTAEIWVRLDDSSKKTLYDIASTAKKLSNAFSILSKFISITHILDSALKPGKAIIEKAKSIPNAKTSRAQKMLIDLEERLSGSYAFDVFAPGSVNYGILVNYRQQWKPLNYQVGELVSTVPLAPKESRRFSKRRVVRKARAEKEVESSLSVRRTEAADTSRADAEIVRRAENKTNFQHAAEGGVNFAVWNAKGSHSIAVDSAKQSSDVKRSFRESVLKSAEEYRQDHRLEINTQASEEYEDASSGEITNPNDELPVTYLFYELQRRYEIKEKIRKITPVILVANDVPNPGEIDEEWLTAHDWILRKVILDDSYLPALGYLSQTFIGDEVSVDVLRNAWLTQMDVVERISQQVTESSSILEQARRAADAAVENYAQSLTEESEGFFESVGEFLFGGDTETQETLRVRMEAAKEALQRVEREEQTLRTRLAAETTTLERATEKYAKAIEDQFNRRTEILRLRAHVRDNILYYMQAIWDHEPPDQRFFRLYKTKVKDFMILGAGTASVSPQPGGVKQATSSSKGLGVILTIPAQVMTMDKTLVEIADLDEMLGYKGNYMIFPLKKSNALTTYMMQDYVDLHVTAQLWDPDETSNYTPDELLDVVRCMKEHQPGRFDQHTENEVRDALVKVLSAPSLSTEEVVVPTDSLYIEALPGAHPILEDFKLVHRAVDVKKAQAQVRHDELDNVRLAARILSGDYEDADIDKKIVIEGDGALLTPTEP